MKSIYQKPSTGEGSGLVLFDEYLNDEDFLEFLIEWSDSIGNKDNAGHTPNNHRDAPLKRKIEQLSVSPQIQLESDPFSEGDAALIKLPVGIFDAFK